MRTLQSMAIIAAMCSVLWAQPPGGMPEKAKHEMGRLHSDVEELGVIQAGPDAAIRKAFATPADDSDKWWINTIGAGANASDAERAATKLLIDDINALKFADFVKPEDPANSWSHYQFRREDDPLQQDWLAPVLPKAKEIGLPVVVIQPPRNGKFGPHNRIVCIVGNYDGRPAEFAALIRARVEAYIHKHAYDGTIAAAAMPPQGHGQAAIGAKPPFDLPPPVAYPKAEDLPKTYLTYDQIRKRFPGIPPEEAAQFAEMQMTAEEIRDASEAPGVNKKTANPPGGAATYGELLLGVGLVLVGMGAMYWYQQRKKPVPTSWPPASNISANG